MIHFGDITKISGYEAPTVDIITGGSPCQDLSVAGKRAGLAGDRSGLFMEQIRIIKEMRDKSARMGADNVRPRYMVWENVPGAFSSNKSEDFRAVLEETARIADKTASISRPPKGKWSTSGCILGNGWSIAWRVHDAQFWGVPQRRRRIALVADFGGESAPEILFERESVSGNIEPSDEKGEYKENVAYSESGTRKTGSDCIAFHLTQDPVSGEVAPCLSGGNTKSGQCMVGVFENHSQDSRYREFENGICETVSAKYGTGGNNQPLVVAFDRAAFNQGINAAYDIGIDEDGIAFTCTAKGPGAVACIGNGQADQTKLSDKVGALNCMHDQQAIITESKIRRLTPLECERLQDFPDLWTDIGGWTDNKRKPRKTSDSARYRALGNSIALPFWQYLADKMCGYFDYKPTMGSLFDGIGGFPLVFSRSGAVPVWASEIEPFAVAVTKRHFPEGENNER